MRGEFTETAGLVVRLVDTGESSRLVTLLTEKKGLIAVSARGVRKGSKSFGGILEPMHRLVLTLEHAERDIARLHEARVDALRLAITGDLDASLCAGYWLRFARSIAHPHGDDAALFRVVDGALDLLNESPPDHRRLEHLVPFAMLAAVGYSLELDQCISCGKACPPERSSAVDGRRGGLLCRTCGHAPMVISGDLRHALREAQGGVFVPLPNAQHRASAASLAQEVVLQHVGRSIR